MSDTLEVSDILVNNFRKVKTDRDNSSDDCESSDEYGGENNIF
ncbi:MAG: hypothetical protein RO257_06980 [Candidatus Kapabacteria bacterium]|nr:hypothetical protein [Candidatus Kapabacteria bacterium]